MLKQELRKEIRSLKRQFSREELQAFSAEIMQRLLVHPRLNAARTILLYHALADEVDTQEAIELFRRQGKTILLPKVIGEGEMEVRVYDGPDSLQVGAFGILEPSGKPFERLCDIDVAVIPGMGFDPSGNRLGRGKGYYDRFLVKIPQAYKLGICFAFQKVDAVPVDEYDVRVDEVL